MPAVRQIISDVRGYLIVLYLDGSLYRQRRDQNSPAFITEWKPVDLDGLDGRVVQVTANHDGALVVLLHDGSIFEDVPVGIGEFGKRKWRHVTPPR
jgi:hypothetical protein